MHWNFHDEISWWRESLNTFLWKRNKVHFLPSKIFCYSFHFRQGSTNGPIKSSSESAVLKFSGSQTFIKTIFSDTRTVSFDCFRIDAFWLVLNLEFCFVQPCRFIGAHFKLLWILKTWLSKGQWRSFLKIGPEIVSSEAQDLLRKLLYTI